MNNREQINGIPVVIPSYEPDLQLVQLCEALTEAGLCDICIVDDGSGDSYRHIFDQIETDFADQGVTLLRHPVNMGKGRALKTAFQALLDSRENLIGCVTADSDGQHTPRDILRCMETLQQNPGSLILGCRQFSGEKYPSRVGSATSSPERCVNTCAGLMSRIRRPDFEAYPLPS